MDQQISSPSERPAKPLVSPLPTRPRPPVSKKASIFLLALMALLLIVFSGLALYTLPQVLQQSSVEGASTNSSATQTQDQGDIMPFSLPDSAAQTPLVLPEEDYVVYEQQQNLYFVPAAGGLPHLIAAPGYVYNRAVPPILMPGGQLLYSGDGLWITNIFGGTAVQVAELPHGQVITSLVLSHDGTTLAWSTEPGDGNGMANIYAGPLLDSRLVYQHSAADCPCFRLFSFLNAPGIQPNTMLLLADDRGDHHAVRYGLWTFNTTLPLQGPQPLLDEDPQQGPLELISSTNSLLYSTYEGIIPPPTDGSVPQDMAALNYANSLNLATIDAKSLTLSSPYVVLPEQHTLNNNADYHWVTTPRFSADGHTLVYVEFSSDAQPPFDRHNALYTVQVNGAGSHVRVGKPRLLATASSKLLELGVWLNTHVLTFYSDGSMYALDIRSGAVATIAQTGAYAHIVAVVEQE